MKTKVTTFTLVALLLAVVSAIILTPAASAAVNAQQIVQSGGTIIRLDAFLTFGSLSNPAKTGNALQIFGSINLGNNVDHSSTQIDIQYSIDQLTWTRLLTVPVNPDGTFRTEIRFPSSGVYTLRASWNNQVKLYTQTIADRFVNLNGSEDAKDIQSAIDSLPATGGIVVIRSGFYDLNGKSIVVKSNLKLIGEGIDQTTVRLYPTIHDQTMPIEDAITSNTAVANLSIEGFTLIQNVVAVGHHGGIILRGSDNYNITIKNMKITDVSGPAVGLSYYTNLLVENCQIERAWTGITFSNGKNALIRGNTVSNTVGDGIFPQLYAENVTIENNYLRNIGDTAIDVAGQASLGLHSEKNIIVKNNTIVNGTVRVTNALDVQIINNSIQYGEINVDGGQGTPANVMVHGNQVVSRGRAGIAFLGAANSSAENNIIIMEAPTPEVKQSGIIAAIWGTGLINNNTIVNAANYGINFGGWALGNGNNITISNNIIQSFGEFGVYDDNRHTQPVYVLNNTFAGNSVASAIVPQNSANRWVTDGNKINT